MEAEEDDDSGLPSSLSAVKTDALFPHIPPNRLTFDACDSVSVLFLMFVGVITRVIRVQHPKIAVYKEPIYGPLLNHYAWGEFYDHPCPNLGQLILFWVAAFSGYSRDYDFSSGSGYGSMYYVMLRLICVFFGALVVPVSYVFLRLLPISHIAAMSGALLVGLDLLLIAESRYFGIDPILHLCSLFAVGAIFVSEVFPTLALLLAEGICLGIVLDFGQVGLIVLAFLRLYQQRNGKWRAFLVKGTILFASIFIVRLAVYSIHLELLPYTDDPAGLPASIKSTIVYSPIAGRNVRSLVAPNRTKFILRDSIAMMLHASSFTGPVSDDLWREPAVRLMRLRSPISVALVGVPYVIGAFRILFMRDFNSVCTGFFEGVLMTCFSGEAVPFMLAVFHCVKIIDTIDSAEIKGFFFYMMQHLAFMGYIFGSCLVYGKKNNDKKLEAFNLILNSKDPGL
jgi:hypothetical protein